jgi:predicted phage terminase large subunit-like protein
MMHGREKSGLERAKAATTPEMTGFPTMNRPGRTARSPSGCESRPGHRGALDFPTLRTKVSQQAKLHKASQILIEDAGLGTGLIQEFKTADFSVIAVKPEYDKKIRMAIQSAKFENGQVFFPKEAPWLRDLEDELFAFPSGRHDDQVDSISQALGHKIASFWTKESLDNYNKFLDALWRDAIFARLSGRPW